MPTQADFQNKCRKCGQCCRKNSPVLHQEDLELVRNRVLEPEHLILLRKGEPAVDNIKNRPILLKKELIKIRGKSPGSWSCMFLDHETSLCLMHDDRPVQCRAQECWNPEKISGLYNRGTLSRKDILAPGSALEELVEMHEQKCPVESFTGLLRIEIYEPGKADQEIKKMISFDAWFRKAFKDRSGISSPALEYCFGRSLEAIAPSIARFIKNQPGPE